VPIEPVAPRIKSRFTAIQSGSHRLAPEGIRPSV
jgi:hypothetical protein